jgi:glycosyltransferase involved in cell wall biosynthesis
MQENARMKIAQVSPLVESVPPQLYGGTERIVSYLTEELVRQGHEVTLYASGDSLTAARLRPMCDRAIRLGDSLADPVAHHMLLLERVVRETRNFDLVHFHLDYLPFSLIRRHAIPALTTLHGRLDLMGLPPLFREYSDMHLVSISDAQRKPMPWAGWAATVHHGIPEDLYQQGDGDGGYLAFLGRISPEKRVDRAIEISRQVGMPLRVAAKVDGADKTYFEENIRALLGDANVDFIGEIGEVEKNEFLGNARALLFPIDWPEPFGLVMIEAMACGTPVIAFRGGSVEEIIEDGITGFVVSDIDEAVKAVSNLDAIDRSVCRARFEERFSVSRMCRDYVRAYRHVLDTHAASAHKNGHFQHHLSGALLSDELTSTETE